jgi:predicted dehydrogenase
VVKGQAFAEEFDCNYFSDNATMLTEIKPDFAIVCTPSGAHMEPAITCAEMSVHVLCDKPIDISLDRADKMIAAAEANSTLLGGIFQSRFEPALLKLKAAISTGKFGGQISMISGSVPWWRDDAYYGPSRWQGTQTLDGGGAIINQGIHTIDAMLWLAGADNPIETVTAFTARRGHAASLIDVEDTAVVNFRFKVCAPTHNYPRSEI